MTQPVETEETRKNPDIVCFRYGHIEAPIGDKLIRCARCGSILIRKNERNGKKS